MARRKRFSQNRRRELMRLQGGRCAYCRKSISMTPDAPSDLATVDHVVALARGGSNLIHNTVLACEPCNHGKGKGRRVPHRDIAPHIWMEFVPKGPIHDARVDPSGRNGY